MHRFNPNQGGPNVLPSAVSGGSRSFIEGLKASLQEQSDDSFAEGLTTALAADDGGALASQIGAEFSPANPDPQSTYWRGMAAAQTAHEENRMANATANSAPVQGDPYAHGTGYQTQVVVGPNNEKYYENFPQQDVTLEEVTPQLMWVLYDEGYASTNDTVWNFVFGTLYVPDYDENGHHRTDANGNSLWVYNSQENWTELDWEVYRQAEESMPGFNASLSELRTDAANNGGDFRSFEEKQYILGSDGNPIKIKVDDQGQPVYDEVTGEVVLDPDGVMVPNPDGQMEAHLNGEPVTPFGKGLQIFGEGMSWLNEENQNKIADTWYRKNILGEDVGFWESVQMHGTTGVAGVGNMGAAGISLLTPGTKNNDFNFKSFDDWAAEQDPEFLTRLYEEGWDYDNDGVADVVGGAALWDAYAHTLTMTQRGMQDMGSDPLSILPGVGRLFGGAGRIASLADTPVGRGLRQTGRFFDIADDTMDLGLGRGLMFGLKELPKMPARALDGGWRTTRTLGERVTRGSWDATDFHADTPISRFFDDIGTGYESGKRERWFKLRHTLQDQGQMVNGQRVGGLDPLTLANIRQDVGLGLYGDNPGKITANPTPVNMRHIRLPEDPRHSFDYEGMDIDRPLPDKFQQPELSRIGRTAQGVGNMANKRPAEQFVKDIGGNAVNVQQQRVTQNQVERDRMGNTHFGEPDPGQRLDRVARGSQQPILDRDRSTVIWSQLSPEQMEAHKIAVDEDLHPALPGRGERLSRESARKRVDDIRSQRNQEEVDAIRAEVVGEIQEAKEAVVPRPVDGNIPLEELQRLIWDRETGMAPQMAPYVPTPDAPTRGHLTGKPGEKYFGDIIADYFERRPVSAQKYYQALYDVVREWQGRGLIGADTTNPRQAATMRMAYEHAWQVAFHDDPRMLRRMPKYKFKSYAKGDPQGEPLRRGEFTVANAYEAIVHGNENMASKGFIYLNRLGLGSIADEAEALRYTRNWIYSGDNHGGGSFIYQNNTSDTFFTHNDPSFPYNPKARISSMEAEHSRVPGKETYSADYSGTRPADSTYADWSRMSAWDVAERTKVELNAEERLATLDFPEAYDLEPVSYLPSEVYERMVVKEAEVGNRVMSTRERVRERLNQRSGVRSRVTKKDPVQIDTSSPETIRKSVMEQEQARPKDGARTTENVRREEMTFYKSEEVPEELEMAAMDRLNILRIRGELNDETLNAWIDQGLSAYDIMRRLSMEEQLGKPHPDANMIFNLETPLEQIPDKPFNFVQPREAFQAQLRQVLKDSSRNDYIELSDETMDAVMDAELLDARNILDATMTSLVDQPYFWPKELTRALNAMGVDFEESLRGQPSWQGFGYGDNPVTRLVTATRAVIGAHYLRIGKQPDAIVQLLKNISHEIDEMAMRQVEQFQTADTLRRGAVRELRRQTYEGKPWMEYMTRDKRARVIKIDVPGFPPAEVHSWASAVQWGRKFLAGAEDTTMASENDLTRAFDTDETWVTEASGRRENATRGEAGVPLNQQRAVVDSWSNNRVVQETLLIDQDMTGFHKQYGTWFINKVDQEEFLQIAPEEFYNEVSRRQGSYSSTDGYDLTTRNGKLEATEKSDLRPRLIESTYKDLKKRAAEIEIQQTFLHSVSRERYLNGHMPIEDMAKLGRRAQDPRQISVAKRTLRQEYGAAMWDLQDLLVREEAAIHRRYESLVRGRTDSDNAADRIYVAAKRKERDDQLSRVRMYVSQDQRGYKRFSAPDARSALRRRRFTANNIKRSYEVRRKYGSRFTKVEEKVFEGLLQAYRDIQSRLPERYHRLVEREYDLTQELRMRNSKQRSAQLKEERDGIRRVLESHNDYVGLTTAWNKIVGAMTVKDARVESRLRDHIDFLFKEYKAKRRDILDQYSGEKQRRLLRQVDEEYIGAERHPNAKGDVRNDNRLGGRIGEVQADLLALRKHMGYRGISEGGRPQADETYLDLAMDLGRAYNIGNLDPADSLALRGEFAAQKYQDSPQSKRNKIFKAYMSGTSDLPPEYEAEFKKWEAQKAAERSAMNPGTTVLVKSENQLLRMHPGERTEMGSSSTIDSADVYDLATEQYDEILSSGNPLNISFEEVRVGLEDSFMKDRGFTRIAPHLYIPSDHPSISRGIVDTLDDDFYLRDSNGDVFNNLQDFFEEYPSLRNQAVRSLDELLYREMRMEQGDISLSNLLRDVDRDWKRDIPDPESFDDPISDLDADTQVALKRYEAIRAMPRDQQFRTILEGLEPILRDPDGELYQTLIDSIHEAAARFDTFTKPGELTPTMNPLDDDIMNAIYRTILEDTLDLGADLKDLTPNRIYAALRKASFKEHLRSQINPEEYTDGVPLNDKWLEDIDWDEQARKIKNAARRQEPVVDTSEPAPPVGDTRHPAWTPTRPRSARRGKSTKAKTRGPVNPDDLHALERAENGGIYWNNIDVPFMASSTSRLVAGIVAKKVFPELNSLDDITTSIMMLRQLLEYSSSLRHFMDPKRLADQMKRSAGFAIEDKIGEQVARNRQTTAALDRYSGETWQIQMEADREIAKNAPRVFDPELGEYVVHPDVHFPNVRPVHFSDEHFIDWRDIHEANQTLTTPGYYQGFTRTEVYLSLHSKNIWDRDYLVDLANRQARNETLSADEVKDLSRLKARFEQYGTPLKENPNFGKSLAADEGGMKTARGFVDMDRYAPDPDNMNIELITRKEFEDVLISDAMAHVIEPRWAGVWNGYDRLAGSWSKWKLMNPLNIVRFMLLNAVGDMGQMLFHGQGRAVAMSLRQMLPGHFNPFTARGWNDALSGKVQFKPDIAVLKRETGNRAYMEISDTWIGDMLANMGRGPSVHKIQGSMSTHLSKDVESKLRKIMDDGSLEDMRKKHSNKFTRTMDQLQGISTALEWNRRLALYGVDVMRRMNRHFDQLQITSLEKAHSMGVTDVTPDDIKLAFSNQKFDLSPVDVQSTLMRAGARSSADTKTLRNWADRVARDWTKIQRDVSDQALESVNRTLFSYEMTDVDQIAKKFLPFHFWATRAIPLYAEIAIRNPYLMSAYQRSIAAMEKMQEEGETPGFMTNMMEFFMSPAGYATFMNPLSAIGMVSVFADSARSQGADDESILGGILRIAGDYGGVNLYPWFSSAFNMAGWLGDNNRGLDFTGFSRERRMLGSTVQLLVAEGYLPGFDKVLMGKPFEQRLREGREWISGVIPGGGHIKATNPNAATEMNFQVMMENVIRERDGMSDLEPLSANQQLEIVAAWENPDDPIYQGALKIYSRGEFNMGLLNSFMPVYLVGQPENAPQLEHVSKMDQPRPPGVKERTLGRDPFDNVSTPGPLDEQWMATWLRATGKEYEEGDLADWEKNHKLRKELIWLSPEAQRLTIMEFQYDNLGTAEQQEIQDTYYGIIYGSLPQHGTLTVGDAVYGYDQVNEMDYQDRKQLADDWIAHSESREKSWKSLLALEKAYRQSTPEFNEYLTWKSEVRGYDSLAEYRAAESERNPIAAKYFAEQRRELAAEYGTDVEKINRYLDIRTTSMETYFAIHGHQYSKTDPKPSQPSPVEHDPIANPRESTGSPGVLGQANDYLSNFYGTPVRLETLPRNLQRPLIALLPPELQEKIWSQL